METELTINIIQILLMQTIKNGYLLFLTLATTAGVVVANILFKFEKIAVVGPVILATVKELRPI